MQWLKITNDTIFRKMKNEIFKIFKLILVINIKQLQNNSTKNTCFCVVVSSENANIDDVIITFYCVNNYAIYLLAHSHTISTMSEPCKSRKWTELSH